MSLCAGRRWEDGRCICGGGRGGGVWEGLEGMEGIWGGGGGGEDEGCVWGVEGMKTILSEACYNSKPTIGCLS